MEIARQEAQQYLLFARYYGPQNLFRFLSVDPKQRSARVQLPASWNRYSYVLGNPITLVDVDGLDVYTHLIKDEVIREEAERIASHPDIQAAYGPGTGNDLWIVDWEVDPDSSPDAEERGLKELGEGYTMFVYDRESGNLEAVSVIDPKHNDGTEKSAAEKQQQTQHELGHAKLIGHRERSSESGADREGKRMSGEVKDGRSMEEHDRQIDETIRQNRERREREKEKQQ